MKVILTMVFCLLLVSCNAHKINFDCAGGKGVGCKSVSEVNALIEHNQLDREIDLQNKKRIWFNSHRDQEQNYYGPQYVYKDSL